MHRVVIESTGTVKGRVIEGTALVPTVSLNGNIYTAEEIDKAKNLNTPLKADWEHTSENIGHVVYTLDPKNHTLFYRATITSESRAVEITEGVHKVSIEAGVEEVARSCTPARCYNLVSGITMEGIGITKQPGVPQTTLSIIESFQDWNPLHEHCEDCSNSSLVHTGSNPESMASKTKETSDKPCNCKESKAQEQDCPEGKSWDPSANDGAGDCVAKTEKKENLGGGPDDQAAGIDQTKPANPCGDGSKLDGDGKCVPEDNQGGSPVSTGPKESTGHGMPNIDEINENLKKQTQMISELKERINKTEQIDELTRMQQFNSNLYKVTKLSPQGSGGFGKDDLGYIAQEGIGALKKFGAYSFDIDLSPQWVAENLNRRKVEEAISFSGDQSNKLAAMSDVFVLPGGKYLKSIRDLVRFEEIPQGADLIKLFKGSIPTNGTITEGSATTASTHTVSTVTLAADVVTGVAQEIKQADVEDSPFPIFDYIAQTARAEVLDHEATLVFDTTANAATPGEWINGNSGAVGLSSDDASGMTMDHVAIAAGLQYYEDQGYDTSFGNIYAAVHPKALKELRTSSNLVRLVQEGDANITKTGRLTHLYGVELIPINAVHAQDNTTNDTYRNVMGVKGHTFALGSKRELTIDMRKIPNESAFDWTWTQRKNAVAFDTASFVRISSAQ